MVKNLTSFPIFARKTKSFSDDLLCQVCFQTKTINYFLLSSMSTELTNIKGAPHFIPANQNVFQNDGRHRKVYQNE